MAVDDDSESLLPGKKAYGDMSDSLSAQVDDKSDFIQAIQDFISRNPHVFGCADIYNVDVQSWQFRVGTLIAILTFLSDGEGNPAVQRFVVVVPPGRDEKDSGDHIWSGVIGALQIILKRDIDQSKLELLRDHIQITALEDKWSQSVLDIIDKQPDRSAVIVTDATSYRDDNVDPYIASGSLTPVLREDVWVPQLHSLASNAAEIVQERIIYVAFDANSLSPQRKELSDLLQSIDGCGVLGSSKENDIDVVLAERANQWNEWALEGQVGLALKDIENLPNEFDLDKPLLCIQMFHRAGLFPQSLEAIRKIVESDQDLYPALRVKLAHMAQAADASRLAMEILLPAIDQLNSREDLEVALDTAQKSGLVEFEERVLERISSLFPNSPSILQSRLHALLISREYIGAADLAENELGDKESADFYRNLARFLSSSGVPDYPGLIAVAGDNTNQADAYRMACVYDAIARNLIVHAFNLVIPKPQADVQIGRWEKLLLQTLERLFLFANQGGGLPVPIEQIQDAVLSLIENLSGRPENQYLRINIRELIQPSVSGVTGLALMAFLVLKLSSRPLKLKERASVGKENMNWMLGRESFFETAFSWLVQQGPIMIGKTTLPESLLTEPADEVISSVTDYLVNVPIASESDIDTFIKWTALAVSVAPHSSDPDCDLRLMRLITGKLATFGHNQLARDLIEGVLQSSANTPRRRRSGWFAMADVYHRCHNYLEGFLAMACALASDDEADEEQVWHEINCIIRLFRDCHLHEQSQFMIKNSRELLHSMRLSDAYSHRLDTLELQIRQMELSKSALSNEDIEVSLSDVVQNGAAVLEHNDTTDSVAIMLGQLIRYAEINGVNVPPEAGKIYADLCSRAQGNIASLISISSNIAPSAEQLLAILDMGGSTRYSGDAGYDMRVPAMIAGRSLADDEFISNEIDVSFALELLADRGVAVPNWDESAVPPPTIGQINLPSEIASSISLEGISVVQVGFDDSGRLVRVSTVGGQVDSPIRELENVISEGRFKSWAEEYPYAYGFSDPVANVFYTTTADLRLSGLPDGPVVIVADVSFQSFPPNLIYVEDEFAGLTRPMAAAPSLSWLHDAYDKGMIGDGRYCAWVSISEEEGSVDILSVVAEDLGPIFKDYSFLVDNGPNLPTAFAGASMAIIVAHGGVHPEGRYFQVISNEGNLRVTANDLANALRNVGIVVLFVCSGGRADKHPVANTTLGLAKQILDRGCAAVIASPWPLDARVPSYWLPEFLRHWSEEKSLIEANFLANQVVCKAFAKDPARGLAMTVFGNPGLRRV